MGQRNRPVVADRAAEMENVAAGRTGVLFRERRYLVGVDSAAPFCFFAGDCNTLRATVELTRWVHGLHLTAAVALVTGVQRL